MIESYKINKNIPEDIIEKYFSGEATNEEIYIVNKLKNIYDNPEEFEFYQKLFQSKADYKEPGYLNLTIYPLSHQKKILELPEPGEIWEVERIPFGSNILPSAVKEYIFILTNPEAITDIDENDKTYNNQEFFTFLFLPVSFEIEHATHLDYLISSNNDILGIPFMIMTDLENSTIVKNLSRKLGRLDDRQIDEILNLYFFSNHMEYDEELLNKTNRGEYYDLDYGEKYEYRIVANDNFQYLNESLQYFLSLVEQFNISEILPETHKRPVFKSAASSDNNEYKIEKEIYKEELFNDGNFIISLVIYEDHNIQFIIKSRTEESNLKCEFLIKQMDKIIEKKYFQPDKRPYFESEKISLYSNKMIKISFSVNDNILYFKEFTYS